MRSFQIQDNRDFMKKLLLGDCFDPFLVSEASITTYVTYHIDGRFKPEYLNTQEQEALHAELDGYTLWKRIRPFFLELTKGKNTPLQFQIVLKQASYNIEKMLTQMGSNLSKNQVNLFLNIRFDGTRLCVITGTSLNVFTLDKTVEQTWDTLVEKFLRQKEIPFTAEN